MTYPTPTHSKDCSYHLDQYSWECDCGAIVPVSKRWEAGCGIAMTNDRSLWKWGRNLDDFDGPGTFWLGPLRVWYFRN